MRTDSAVTQLRSVVASALRSTRHADVALHRWEALSSWKARKAAADLTLVWRASPELPPPVCRLRSAVRGASCPQTQRRLPPHAPEGDTVR